jgi:hypothetical protein
MRAAPALLALISLLSPSRGAALEPFSDWFFRSRLHRIENPALDGYLKLKWFHDLMSESIDPSKLDLDSQIDFELLSVHVAGKIRGYLLRQPGADRPFHEVLPPSNVAELWIDLIDDGPGGFCRRANRLGRRIREWDPGPLSAEQVERGRGHVSRTIDRLDTFLGALRGDPRSAAMQEATRALIEALKDLRARLSPSPGKIPPPDRRPAKEESYLHLLTYQVLCDHNPQTLREFGQTRFDRTLRDLEALARRIDPKKSWVELAEESKKKHFTPETLHDESAKLAIRARDFVLARDLATVPPSAREFEIRRADPKAITPFGHYQGATDKAKGAYISAPLPAGAPAEELAQRLRDNNLYWTSIVALHEAVPGHHLQFEVMHGLKRSRIRRLFFPTTYVEGWGLYCEHMMFLNGYFGDDPLYELTLLRMKLWRCARILIDVGLQTGTLTKPQAVELLAEKVRLEPLSAKFEVDHYESRPTYFTGYLIGYDFFVELRKRCEAAMGAKFDQKAFHDRILSLGPLPMRSLERLMLHWAKPD